MDKFEQELCRNDAMKDILDGKGKLKRVKRGGLGTDHLTWRGGVMVFCFVQNFFFGQHKSLNINFVP